MQAKKTVEDANKILNQTNNRKLIYEFLEKFSQCEVYIRPILKNNLLEEEVSKIKDEDIKLNYFNICSALTQSGIRFKDKSLLSNIFSETDTLGKSSCKWLRNKITHSLMKRALKEVCSRYDELIGYMNTFIETIDEQSY